MNVRDHSIRRKAPRIRWFLTIMLSFTAGVVAAATLFAYTSRIPIPIKVSPTRGADDLLARQKDKSSVLDLRFQENLQQRELITSTPVLKPVKVSVAAPQLPAGVRDVRDKPKLAVQKQVASKLAIYVQAGAFADLEAANKLSTVLDGQGLPVEVRTATSSNDLHRVVIGPYLLPGDAETVRAQLALQGRVTQLLRLSPQDN